PTSTEVSINTLWFLSLTLSLIAVFNGILCLQWLREYQSDSGLPDKEAIALRQMRFEGLERWRVPEIITSLPILLLTALALFFAGLLQLMWSKNSTVAIALSAVVGIAMTFIIATTFLPGFQVLYAVLSSYAIPQCPYKSPQSWLVSR
ncbi:hypothetical protein FA15DRAFT_546384, partial [Coprinopsis marcescibilis]